MHLTALGGAHVGGPGRGIADCDPLQWGHGSPHGAGRQRSRHHSSQVLQSLILADKGVAICPRKGSPLPQVTSELETESRAASTEYLQRGWAGGH